MIQALPFVREGSAVIASDYEYLAKDVMGQEEDDDQGADSRTPASAGAACRKR